MGNKIGRELDNLQGRQFGDWTVIAHAHKNELGVHYWTCKCSCGTVKNVSAGNLRSKQSKSCGSGHRPYSTHNPYTGTKILNTFIGIHQRCNNSKDTSYSNYGGRGIQVCERWDDFKNFLADMGEPISYKYSIDRIDVDGDYEPDNCRWATRKEQMNNKRVHKYLYAGKLAKLTGYCRERIRQFTYTTTSSPNTDLILVPYIQETISYGPNKSHAVYKNEAINFLKSHRNRYL